ncbi:hypothetical protein PVAG01_05332 [Phlyctema vagabunda]|uniref:Uncharacterized protein n=1 Tax=Phlyctema vagabunda TaxID=108571 RepID=A0ABR4PJS7_9HELO
MEKLCQEFACSSCWPRLTCHRLTFEDMAKMMSVWTIHDTANRIFYK